MQRHTIPTIANLLGRSAPLLAVALLSGCAGPGSRPAPVETHDEQGFRISEELRVRADVRATFERALERLAEERYAEGIALLREVTEAAPEATLAHIDLGIAYRHADDLEHAEQSLAKALELNPRHPVAHNELGIVQRRMGRFAAARASYEHALELHPGFHFARRNLAILCDLYLSDLPCALRNYQAYALEVPGDREVAMWVADLRNRIGEREDE